jgi:hypothetical protein
MIAPDQEAELLRDAVARGDFAAAENAAVRYTNLLRPLVTTLPRAEAVSRLRAACDLLEWSRRNLCTARARIVEEVRRLDRLSQYHALLAATAQTLNLRG